MDEEELQRIINDAMKDAFKRVQTLLNARLTAFLDQINAIESRQNNLAKAMDSMLQAAIINARSHDLTFLELRYLEDFIQEKFPELKQSLKDFDNLLKDMKPNDT